MDKVETFVRKFYPHAILSEDLMNVPALFTMAQAALETGWGEKSIGNNFFGITADVNYTGKKVLVDTFEFHDNPNVKYPEIKSITPLDNGKYRYEVKRYFRDYATVEDCIKDHNLFLLKDRYRKAFDWIDNPKNFATEVAKGGYATGLNYAATLHDIIDRIAKVVKDKELDREFDKIAVVNVNQLNVRSCPAVTGKVRKQVVEGERLRVLEERSGWYKVHDYTAFAASKFIDNKNVVTANILNIRADVPDGPIIVKVNKGQKLIVIDREGEWCRVSLRQWWVLAKYTYLLDRLA